MTEPSPLARRPRNTTIGLVGLAALLAPGLAPGLTPVAPAPDGAAWTSPAAAPPSRPDDGEEGRALKRLLHLRGGGVLRAIARRDGPTWFVKEGAGWRDVPAAAVARVELEKEALARFQRDLRAAFRAEDPLAARARVAGAGLDAGLLQEGLDAAEVLLRDHPGHAGTRTVLLDRAALFGVPAPVRGADGALDFEPLLRFGATATRALREVCVLRLGEAARSGADRDALRATLAAQLGQVLPRRRAFAALATGRLFPGEAVRELLVHSLRDAAEDVRGEAARAAGAAGEPGLVLPLVRVLEGSASPSLRRHAAEALGNMGYRSAVAPLVGRLSALASSAAAGGGAHRVPHSNIFVGRQFAFIQDFDVEVAQLQSVADPQVNVLMEGKAFDAGVVGSVEYRTVVAAERAAIQRALEALTGERPGGRARDWIEWWAAQGG